MYNFLTLQCSTPAAASSSAFIACFTSIKLLRRTTATDATDASFQSQATVMRQKHQIYKLKKRKHLLLKSQRTPAATCVP